MRPRRREQGNSRAHPLHELSLASREPRGLALRQEKRTGGTVGSCRRHPARLQVRFHFSFPRDRYWPPCGSVLTWTAYVDDVQFAGLNESVEVDIDEVEAG